MRRFSVRRPVAVALMLAASAVACSSIVDARAGASRSLLGGEAMRLQLSKTTVMEGDLLDLTVTLSNLGDATLTFEGNTCPFNVFEVEDAAGARIDPRLELILCAAFTKTERVAPGQSYSWSTQWVAARYGPATTARAPGAQVVRIRPRYWVDGRKEVSGAWQSVTVTPRP